MSEFVIHDPTTSCMSAAIVHRDGVHSLAGAVVGFIDNSKPNFNHLVEDLSGLFLTRYGAKQVVVRRKQASSRPATEETISEMAATCDVVITGSGD